MGRKDNPKLYSCLQFLLSCQNFLLTQWPAESQGKPPGSFIVGWPSASSTLGQKTSVRQTVSFLQTGTMSCMSFCTQNPSRDKLIQSPRR